MTKDLSNGLSGALPEVKSLILVTNILGYPKGGVIGPLLWSDLDTEFPPCYNRNSKESFVNRKTEIGRFLAKTDSGKEYTIVEYQEYISAATLHDPHAEIPGMKILTTSTGFSVNYVDAKTFKIVSTNEIVRKI